MDKKNLGIKHIKFKDAPESWQGRVSCIKDGIGYKPCKKCKEYPDTNGHDACLGTLGSVINACCGHGKNEGYIQFDNGIRVSGHFKIERFEVSK